MPPGGAPIVILDGCFFKVEGTGGSISDLGEGGARGSDRKDWSFWRNRFDDDMHEAETLWASKICH